MDYSPPMLRLLSVCQVGDCCKLLLDRIDILKWIRYPNYKLSLIEVVLSISYFVSAFEIWFHSTFIFSTKNFPSSSSGIRADSRSRYWCLFFQCRCIDFSPSLVLILLFRPIQIHQFTILFSTQNCHNPLSRLTSSRRFLNVSIPILFS